MNDSTQAYNRSDISKFTPRNPYDYFIFDYPNLFCMELKSTQLNYLTFWREDFEEEMGEDAKFSIRKNQIQGLERASKYEGVFAGLIINFRTVERTYYLSIQDFLSYVEALPKRSINEKDVVMAGGLLIPQEKVRTRFRYAVKYLLDQLRKITPLRDELKK
jgi:recombination protein U